MTQFPRIHRARQFLDTWTRAAPWRSGYWRAIDRVRQCRPLLWPAAVFVPLEEAGEIVAAAWRAHGRTPTEAAIVREACELQGLAAWRLTRGVYRYDPSLAEALRATPLTGDLPADVLTRLPEWAVYIETPGETIPTSAGDTPLLGCLTWLDWVSATARDPDDWTPAASHYQLQVGLDFGGAGLQVANVPLVGSLEAAIDTNIREWQDAADRLGASSPRAGYASAARRYLPGLIARVLYLCAEEADFGGAARPRRPQPTRTKQGYRLFPAERLTTWEVGVRIGAALRQAQAGQATESGGEGHARPRAHIRRAHWHTFIAGPRADPSRQERRIKWLPPIPVNVKDVDELPATIRRVE